MVPRIYFAEGNIAGGKTTLLESIEKEIKETNRNDIEVIYEPVSKWQEMGLLGSFYSDQKRWSYTFQNVAFITKIMELEKLTEDKIYIIERSPMTDRNCFAELCYESGYISEMEMTAYTMWYNHYVNKVKYNGFIYLNAEPSRCFERINIRNRGEESRISLDYLENLHIKHKKWLSNDKHNILYLEDNYTLDTIQDAVRQVLDFVNL